MKTSVDKQLYMIAAMNSWEVENRGDLEPRQNDSEDRIELSVGAIKAMLEQAYELGLKTAELEIKQNAELKQKVFRQAFNNYQRSNRGN